MSALSIKSCLAIAALICAAPILQAGAVASLTLSNQANLEANDDGSTGLINLNLDSGGVNFFGQSFTQVYVNNNGNVTFSAPLAQFTPNGLAAGVGFPIIAPFFADVDTRGTRSGLVTYGNAAYNGHQAFVVNWPNVGYFDSHDDLLNTFQLILTDRSDTGAGNFDIEFNYDQMQWETGDASDGAGGVGGTSAVAGYSNGLSTGNVYYQLPGSLVNGALIDTGADALVSHSLNSSVAGRYDFQVRNGEVISGVPEPASLGLIGAGILGIGLLKRKRRV